MCDNTVLVDKTPVKDVTEYVEHVHPGNQNNTGYPANTPPETNNPISPDSDYPGA